jgi:hypothetical protein
MPTTARVHFNEDIARAEQVLEQARTLHQANHGPRLAHDVRIAAIAMAAGAMDAHLVHAEPDVSKLVHGRLLGLSAPRDHSRRDPRTHGLGRPSQGGSACGGVRWLQSHLVSPDWR